MLKYLVMAAFFICCIVVNKAEAQLAWDSNEAAADAALVDPTATVTFPFRNATDHDISIKDVKPSCGCTSAKPDKTLYHPGEHGVLTATVQLGSHTGTVVKTIDVFVSDSTEVHQLRVTIRLPELVHASAILPAWHVGDSAAPFIFRLTVTDALPLRLTGVKPSKQRVKAVLKVIEEGKTYQLEVQPTDTREPLYGGVQLIIDAKFQGPSKEISFPVTVLPAAASTQQSGITKLK